MLMGVLRKFFQEVVVPELKQIRAETAEVKTTLQLTNKRLDDINAHLLDQSRRIDAVREELTDKTESLREELTHKFDSLREELTQQIESVREELSQRIESVREELSHRIDETHKRIDETNKRIDETNDRLNRLYEVIVRREEHEGLSFRLARLEEQVKELMGRAA